MSNIYILRQLIKEFLNLFHGIRLIKKLPRSPVTIFGSAALTEKSIYMKQAHELAHKFVEKRIPTLTGGGSGIMEAAQRGASHLEVSVISTIGIKIPGVKQYDCCGIKHITMNSIFTRKWLLINYSVGFVVFPGGFGTVNEFTEVITLIQLGILKKVPVILVGNEYWKNFIAWLEECSIKEGIIKPESLKLFIIVDNIEEVISKFT